jgi:hypothetical protein
MDTDSFINAIQKPIEITWRDIATANPYFVQWVVQRFGPLPDGAIKRDDYDKFVDAYNKRG